MSSNGLRKALPCVFQECCPVLRLKSKILPNCFGIASGVSLQVHECQMVWRIFLTPMLKNVLMWIRGSTMCSTRTLTSLVPVSVACLFCLLWLVSCVYLNYKPWSFVLRRLCRCICHFDTRFFPALVEPAEISSTFVVFEEYILHFPGLQDLARNFVQGSLHWQVETSFMMIGFQCGGWKFLHTLTLCVCDC